MSNISGEIGSANYTLSCLKTIELLISYRYLYDIYLFSREDSNQSIQVSDILPFKEDIVILYTDLDICIKQCGFTDEQLKMIDFIGKDYTYDMIADELDLEESSIESRIRAIYRRIKKENDWQWRKWFYTEELGLRTKKCSKCKDELPATEEFYSNDNRNKDGLQGRCRLCR